MTIPTPTPSNAEREARFRRRFVRRRWAAFGSIAAFVIALFAIRRLDVPAAMPLLFMAFFVILAVRVAVWRCPRCGTGFGRSIIVMRCRHCALELDAFREPR